MEHIEASDDQHSSADTVDMVSLVQHAPEESSGEDGPCLQSNMNDSALDLQEQIRREESRLASTSGRDNEHIPDERFPGHR